MGYCSRLYKEGIVSEFIIEGMSVDRVNQYECLRICLDNKLIFECNINYILKEMSSENVLNVHIEIFGVRPKTLDVLL